MSHKAPINGWQLRLMTAGAFLVLLALISGAQAGQGCPFDDGSCQEYCGKVGCGLGYCGHFAWIQCICRKCGADWSDKLQYNPNQRVNQTELASLKLAPIVPSPGQDNNKNKEQQAASTNVPTTTSTSTTETPTTMRVGSPKSQSTQKLASRQQSKTLTVLLVPDLSSDKLLDPNEIPEENSDKFLDYLALNHEKLARATSVTDSDNHDDSDESEEEAAGRDEDGEATGDEHQQQANNSTENTDDIVEIQITSSNNNSPPDSGREISANKVAGQPSTPNQQTSPTTRLLKMAVKESSLDEVD